MTRFVQLDKPARGCKRSTLPPRTGGPPRASPRSRRTSVWEEDTLDLVGPACISFARRTGSLAKIAITGRSIRDLEPARHRLSGKIRFAVVSAEQSDDLVEVPFASAVSSSERTVASSVGKPFSKPDTFTINGAISLVPGSARLAIARPQATARSPDFTAIVTHRRTVHPRAMHSHIPWNAPYYEGFGTPHCHGETSTAE